MVQPVSLAGVVLILSTLALAQQNDTIVYLPTNITEHLTVDQALLKGQEILLTVEQTMNAKLPPGAALTQREQLLAEARDGIEYCDTELRRNGNIGQYNRCCSGQYGMAMEAVGQLAATAWPAAKSDASRLTLFW